MNGSTELTEAQTSTIEALAAAARVHAGLIENANGLNGRARAETLQSRISDTRTFVNTALEDFSGETDPVVMAGERLRGILQPASDELAQVLSQPGKRVTDDIWAERMTKASTLVGTMLVDLREFADEMSPAATTED